MIGEVLVIYDLDLGGAEKSILSLRMGHLHLFVAPKPGIL